MFPEKSTIKLLKTNQNDAKTNTVYDTLMVDEFLRTNIPILRIYSWEKSLTIGMGQKIENFSIDEYYNTNFAKRITGGGLLYHGHDISYSLILPKSYLEEMNVKESYKYLCKFLLDFYGTLGLNANYATNLDELVLSKNQFCQIGYEAYDIIVKNIKLGGNAQKRTKKFIFQHGSIPIEPINNSLEFGKSLCDLNISLTYEDAEKLIIQSFQKIFNIEFDLSNPNLLLPKKEQDD
jgi:lipoate-protein ligase A